MSEEIYLGDGLYASFDGWMIKLRAPQGTRGDQVVYLEPDVYEALTKFAGRFWSAPSTAPILPEDKPA